MYLIISEKKWNDGDSTFAIETKNSLTVISQWDKTKRIQSY